jgi:hypothetical protein
MPPLPHSHADQRGQPVGTVHHTEAGGWDPSRESDSSKSEQIKQCMDLEHYIH